MGTSQSKESVDEDEETVDETVVYNPEKIYFDNDGNLRFGKITCFIIIFYFIRC